MQTQEGFLASGQLAELFFIACEHRERRTRGESSWPVVLACSGTCQFLIYRLIRPSVLERYVSRPVLHLGKPQEQPVARQVELGLEIRCRCCFYGTLNINRFGPKKKGTTDRAMSLMLSLTSCREIVSDPQFSYMERVVLFPFFSLYLRAIVGIKWDVDKPSVTCRALCMCTICSCNSYFMN